MKANRFMTILIVISMLAALFLVGKRVSVERAENSVDFVLDYYEIEDLAEQSDKPVEWWLKEFKKLGASSVGINYETLESMQQEDGDIQIHTVDSIMKEKGWEEKYPDSVVEHMTSDKVDRYDLLVSFGEKEDFDFASKGLAEKYGDKVKAIEDEDGSYIILNGSFKEALYTSDKELFDNAGESVALEKQLKSSMVVKLPVGIDKEKIETIQSAGLKVMPRIANSIEGWSGQSYIESAVKDYESVADRSPYMIFGGKEVIGSNKSSDVAYDFLNDNKLSLGIVETVVERGYVPQVGLSTLLEKMNYNVGKVYSMPLYIQQRYKYNSYEGAEEIGNVLYRAITERNVNIIYFRPFKTEDNEYVTNLKDYKDMFSDLSDRLDQHGIAIGEAKPYKSNQVSRVMAILVGIGTAAAGVMILSRLFKLRNSVKLGLLALGILGVAGAIIALGRTGYMMVAVLTAIAFPSLGLIHYNKALKKIYSLDSDISYKSSLIKGTKVFLTTSLITSVGSLLIAGLMSSSRNILDIDYFQGVKFAQYVPFAVYGISFLGYFGYKREKKSSENRISRLDIKAVLNDNIKVLYVLGALAVAFVGYIYIARTGHETSVKPSELELMFRNLLEEKLLARPRTKEFLIAFPALTLGVFMAKNRYKAGAFLFGLLGVIGQTSIVNTFCHFKTPVYISALRLVYSLGIGVVVGAAYLLGLYVLNLAVRNLIRRQSE